MQNDTPIVQDQTQEAPPPQELPTDQPAEQPEGEQKAEGEADKEPAKPEKTPEQRELERARRVIDRRTKRIAQLEAQVAQFSNTPRPIDDINAPRADDSEPLTLSRAEIAELVKREAEKLAPTLQRQRSEIEHRQTVVKSLSESWGSEKFDTVAAELDEVLGGLAVNGRPKPATEAIFASEAPKALIEYLVDPDNADDAEQLASLNPVQAGRFVAKLEAKIQAQTAKAKPQRSNAPAPIEPVRAQGTVNSMPDPKNLKAWILEMNRREAAGKL